MSEEVTQVKSKGRGYIYVSAGLWEQLGKPETPKAWHKALMLPDMYEVGGSVLSNDRFEILVLHEWQTVAITDKQPEA